MACVVFYLDDGSTRVVTLNDADTATIGRHPQSVVHLTSPSVSAHHATVKKRDKGFYVQDLGSSNGTRLNGAEIEEALMNDGDRVSFGDVQAVFYAGEPPPLQDAAPAPPPPAQQKTAVLPPPDAPRVEEAPPVTGAPPVHHRRFRRRSVSRETSSGYSDDSGGGCATAMFLTGLFVTAFFIGLALRHLKETDRSLLSDIVIRVTKSLPKVKIEQ